MRVAGIERYGAPVEMIEVGDPRAPRDGELLIGVRAAGVGKLGRDRSGGEWDVGRGAAHGAGRRAAGVVAAVGPGVVGWLVGDEALTHALPLADQGTWGPWLFARVDVLA